MLESMDLNEAKRAAGEKAAELIRAGMIVGLGSGSTSRCFIEALGRKVEEGLRIQAVPSSRASAELAKKLRIQVVDINEVKGVDLTIDGADEIDIQKRMIKGGGGALLREKVLAASSGEMIVIVDESKLVRTIGGVKLPVEVLYYGFSATRRKIEQLGYSGDWRVDRNGTPFVTENGNLIFDIQFASPLASPEEDDEKLIQIPGVIETGFFLKVAGRVIVGFSDGTTELR